MLGEYLELVVFRNGRALVQCRKCGQRLAEHGENYLEGLAIWDSPVTTLPLVGPPEDLVDDLVLFRRYLCPGCRTQVLAEIVREGDEPKADTTVLLPTE